MSTNSPSNSVSEINTIGNGMNEIQSEPTCDKCGLAITTGMMAALCPQADQCEFWPHSNGDDDQDGVELFMALAWIHNACEQIGLQIEDRKRLEAENASLRADLAYVRTFLEDRQDVRDGPEGTQLPNEAMSLLQELDDKRLRSYATESGKDRA